MNALLIAWWLTGGFIWTPLAAFALLARMADKIAG